MPRPRSAGSEASDIDEDGLAEQELELQKLRHQHRLLENDRKAYAQESQDVIKKQRSQIEKLQGEQEELKKDLKLIESSSNQARNDKTCESLGELGRKKRDIDSEIEEEKKKQLELDAQIRDMERKLNEKQKRGVAKSGGSGTGTGGGSGTGSGGVSAGKKGSSTKTTNQRHARKLEDQLQLANGKFGKVIEANRLLRKEIDTLRIERQRFDQFHKKLEKQKEDLQQELNEVIDQSTQAHDHRVEAQEKMASLNDRAEKDVQQHNSEMKELVRVIDHDRRLREFMNAKSKERQEDQQLVEWRVRKEIMEAEKKKAGQTDTVDSYEAAFERIREITNEEDIEQIVRQFIEVEDENFALFNFVNDQNNRIEYLQDEIDEIKGRISNFETESTEVETKRQVIMKELEEKQRDLSKQADTYDERTKELNKVLDQVKAGVGALFTKTGCDRATIDDLLNAKEGVTDQNLLQYLGIIEARANQLLLTRAYIIKHQSDEEFAAKRPVLLGDGPHPPVHPPSILPPAVGEEYESDTNAGGSDDEARPLTIEELMAKATKFVIKRESWMRKQDPFELTDVPDRSKKDRHHKQQKAVKA